MFEFIDEIISFFRTIGQFLFNAVEAMVSALGFLATSTQMPLAFVPLMPGIIGTAIVIFMAVYVIKFIVGLFT